MRTLLAWLLLTGVAEASCVTLNQSTWSQDEKNGTLSVAVELAFDSGHPEVPQVTGNQVCVTTFDPVTVITQSAMETRWASDDTTRQAATTALQQEQQSALAEKSTNAVCGGTVAGIDAKIDTLTNGIVDLASAKTALNAALKKIARCLRAMDETR